MNEGRSAHVTKPKFYSMQDDGSARFMVQGNQNTEDTEALIKAIDDNVVGKNYTFIGPFGKRKVAYCDYYGSGRALQFIEEYIQKEVLPSYGEDFPAVSHSSIQSNHYRDESRAIVGNACRCSQTDRIVLGGTLDHLTTILRSNNLVVFLGYSDDLKTVKSWENVGAKVIYISETREGFLDLNDLETKLQAYSKVGQKLVGCFSTVSRVTGALVDTVAATLILHQYGALSVWCHSLAIGWCGIDMNPDLPGLEDSRMVQKDAVYFSCKQIPGGLHTTNVLIVNKSILNRGLFSDNTQEMKQLSEECDVVEAIRVGLVMQLRDAVGQQTIMLRQENITRQVLSHIRNIPELILLGGYTPKRVPVFPLLVRHPRGAFLHHNFVCAVLSDVFGIQASSSSCNGDILCIDEDLAKEYSKVLGDESNLHSIPSGNEHLRPGFFHLSFPYFMSDSELAYALEALKMVATEGWKILPQYVVNQDNGTWAHRTHGDLCVKKSLSSITYKEGKMVFSEKSTSVPGVFPQSYYECLQTARNLFNSARKSAQRYPLRDHDIKFSAKKDYLRWYMLPMEAQELLLGNSGNVKHIVPFDPAILHSGRRSAMNSGNSSPVPSASPRHYSLSAIDVQDFAMFNSKFKSLSRESSIVEATLVKPYSVKMESPKSSVQFALGEEVTSGLLYNAPINRLIKVESKLSRTRCHSLGSDSPPPPLNTQTRLSLGTNNSYMRTLETCNCSSQTDLQSLDDLSNSPSYYMYTHKEHESNSDCSHAGRTSPTASITSHTSEDLQAYVKEMTKEIATELKSEIREVISKVEDALENTDPVNIENRNYCLAHNLSSHSIPDPNSVSISDVAEYLMGVSKEMASEVKHEIREMVNQVDEIISPEVNNTTGVNFYLSSPSASRKNSPPEMLKRHHSFDKKEKQRVKSIPQSVLSNTGDPKGILRKSPTSPVIMVSDNSKNSPDSDAEKDIYFRSKKNIGQSVNTNESPQNSPDNIPHDIPCAGSMSFNSSDTSSPDTIIQVLNTTVSTSIPKSISSQKLSDDDNSCNESECQPYCKSRIWYHNNSVSSQDSGINMSFVDHDHGTNTETVRKRPSSDSSCYRRKRNHNRIKNSSTMQRQEKNEVPDIIEGVPACSEDYRSFCRIDGVQKKLSSGNRVEFRDRDSTDNRSTFAVKDYPHLQRVSNSSSTTPDSDISRKSSTNSDSYSSKKSSTNTLSSEDFARCSDLSCCQHGDSIGGGNTNTSDMCRSRSQYTSDSSSESDYPADCSYDDDGKWYCPPKSIWKGSVEAIQEFGMIRHQDRILVCLSGGSHSLALLHTLHQYQFYARAKGIHFTIGAVTICDGMSDIDPLNLMSYCKTLGIKYIYQDNVDNTCNNYTKQKDQDLCSFTNHWIRRQIYRCASEHGYNVIATGQHLDDVARSFVISVFSNGRLKTMKAHYFIKELNLRVIRPLIYVREKNLNLFVESRHLPQFRLSKEGDGRMDDSTFKSEKSTQDQAENHSKYEKEKSSSPPTQSKVNRSMSAPCSSRRMGAVNVTGGRVRARSAPCGPQSLEGFLELQEANIPGLFTSLKSALHPLISARNIEKDMKEYRHRKRSVIQMKNGAPVYNSDDGTDEEPVP